MHFQEMDHFCNGSAQKFDSVDANFEKPHSCNLVINDIRCKSRHGKKICTICGIKDISVGSVACCT